MEAYDGVAEVWWDSLDALVAAVGSEEGQRANETLAEDEAQVHRLRALLALRHRGAHLPRELGGALSRFGSLESGRPPKAAARTQSRT